MKIQTLVPALLMTVLSCGDLGAQPATSENATGWGFSGSLGGAGGGVGLSVLSRRSRTLMLVAGVGYWPGLKITDILFFRNFAPAIEERRRELSIFLCSRWFVSDWIYLLGGVGARRLEGLLRENGSETKVTVGSVGIPLAVGLDFGERTNSGINVEAGYSLFWGPGAQDVGLLLHYRDILGHPVEYRSTVSGSSGLLLSIAINCYF